MQAVDTTVCLVMPIFNQPIEFGHYVPANKGGADLSSNGRMQAMSANRAMGDRLGVAGACQQSGDYQNMRNDVKRLRWRYLSFMNRYN